MENFVVKVIVTVVVLVRLALELTQIKLLTDNYKLARCSLSLENLTARIKRYRTSCVLSICILVLCASELILCLMFELSMLTRIITMVETVIWSMELVFGYIQCQKLEQRRQIREMAWRTEESEED